MCTRIQLIERFYDPLAGRVTVRSSSSAMSGQHTYEIVLASWMERTYQISMWRSIDSLFHWCLKSRRSTLVGYKLLAFLSVCLIQ